MVPGGGALPEEGGCSACISVRPHWGNGEKMGNPNLLWSCRPLAETRVSVAWAAAPMDLHGLTRRLARVGSGLEFVDRAKVTLKELLLGCRPPPTHLAAPTVTVTEA